MPFEIINLKKIALVVGVVIVTTNRVQVDVRRPLVFGDPGLAHVLALAQNCYIALREHLEECFALVTFCQLVINGDVAALPVFHLVENFKLGNLLGGIGADHPVATHLDSVVLQVVVNLSGNHLLVG